MQDDGSVRLEDDEEQRGLLRDSVRRMLQQNWLKRAQPDVTSVWTGLVNQGLFELDFATPGFGLREILLIMMELGRVACPAPFLPAILTTIVLGDASPARRGHRVAISLGEYDGDPGAGSIASADGRLSGKLRFVENLDSAEYLLAIGAGSRAFLMLIPAPGIGITMATGLSGSPLSDVVIDHVEAADYPIAHAKLEELKRIARLGFAARALGAARRGFDLVVDHAKTRHQFGQPIGKFQAVQHKLATSLILLDACELQLTSAADAYDVERGTAPILAESAIAFCAQTLRQVALETQHVLGAIGFAEEHECPQLFRFIHGDVARFGGARRARTELAHLILDNGCDFIEGNDQANGIRGELKEWLSRHWTDDDRKANRALPFEQRKWSRDFAAKLGEGGWTTLTWPKSADGQDRSPLEQLAYLEEMLLAKAPADATVCSARIVGPEIVLQGSPELRWDLLPGIRAGRVSFCLGYSEPEAGSDLASLRTRAIAHGDDYIINGQKIWTTDGHRATHMILAARTNPDPHVKHGGITLFLVPMNTSGITVRPSMALHGHKFCSIFFDDVRVPETAMLGPLNGGWRVLSSALASERIIMGAFAMQVAYLLRSLIHLIRNDRPDLAVDPVVRDKIAGLACETEAARQLALRSVIMSGNEIPPLVEAAMSKVYASELSQRLTEAAIDIFGSVALLNEDAEGVLVDGRIDQMLRQSIMMVVGGGTNEIQRTLIARRGLGLPG